jgi:diguanylate cyclase (GGDEF)-like protein
MNDINKNNIIKLAQLEQLLSVNGRTLIASSFIAILLAYMQRGVISLSVVFSWLSAMLALNLIRILMGRYQQKNPVIQPEQVNVRLNQFRFGVFLSSLLWGSSSYLLFPTGFIQHQMFLIYLLTGLSASAVISYSIDRFSALTFIFFTVVPMLVVLFMMGDPVSMATSFAGVVYILFIIFSVRNFHRNLIDGVILRHEAIGRETEIKQLAFYDALTNLPNRRLLLDRLNRALALTARTNQRGALLFLDLDHFKELNDTLGHDMGDLLLKQVAERLTKCVRETDSVARFGGDEFVVMLEGLSVDTSEAAEQVQHVTKQINTSLNQPFKLKNYEYQCTPSIGVAMFGEHGNSPDDILKHADIAMYQAKKAGRNITKMFEFTMKQSALTH